MAEQRAVTGSARGVAGGTNGSTANGAGVKDKSTTTGCCLCFGGRGARAKPKKSDAQVPETRTIHEELISAAGRTPVKHLTSGGVYNAEQGESSERNDKRNDTRRDTKEELEALAGAERTSVRDMKTRLQATNCDSSKLVYGNVQETLARQKREAAEQERRVANSTRALNASHKGLTGITARDEQVRIQSESREAEARARADAELARTGYRTGQASFTEEAKRLEREKQDAERRQQQDAKAHNASFKGVGAIAANEGAVIIDRERRQGEENIRIQSAAFQQSYKARIGVEEETRRREVESTLIDRRMQEATRAQYSEFKGHGELLQQDAAARFAGVRRTNDAQAWTEAVQQQQNYVVRPNVEGNHMAQERQQQEDERRSVADLRAEYASHKGAGAISAHEQQVYLERANRESDFAGRQQAGLVASTCKGGLSSDYQHTRNQRLDAETDRQKLADTKWQTATQFKGAGEIAAADKHVSMWQQNSASEARAREAAGRVAQSSTAPANLQYQIHQQQQHAVQAARTGAAQATAYNAAFKGNSGPAFHDPARSERERREGEQRAKHEREASLLERHRQQEAEAVPADPVAADWDRKFSGWEKTKEPPPEENKSQCVSQ